jgi:hypothetical protein
VEPGQTSGGAGAIVRLPMMVLFALLGWHLLILLIFNDGHFVYSLDDAYIHLSLAEKIAGGTYGLNAGEAAAPSSSILWPFLLVPLAPFAIGAFVPLLLNIAAAAGTLYLYALLVAEALGPLADRCSRLMGVLLLLVLIPGTNLTGLVLTGMEHSLQVLLTAALVLGLTRQARTGQAAWWLFAVAAAGPLVRYENLAFSLPALLYLAANQHGRRSLVALVGVGAGVGGFSLFLLSMGLAPMPASVSSKSQVFWDGVHAASLLRNLERNLSRPEGVLLALGLVVLVAVVLSRRWGGKERGVAAVMASAAGLHLLVGQFGYQRYEVYAWTAVVLALLFLWRQTLVGLAREEPAWKVAFLLLVLTAVTCRPYVRILHTSPIGSNNIYEQQFQMHRFVAEYYQRPVAANDLGLLTYGSDHYVLDVFGLASAEALAGRRGERGGDYLEKLAQEHDVHLAMIYSGWLFPVPAAWMPVAELRLGRERVTPAKATVTFYALDEATFYEVQGLLTEFAPTLPASVEFEIAPEGVLR